MKTVLITGGARGIGKAISEKFAQNGYNVVINYSTSEEPAYSVKKEAPAKLIKSKSINYSQNNGSLQVVLVKPDRFDEVTTIADHLNEGKTVVLNLEESQRETSRRIVDFLSGVAYANGGNMRKVAKNTFIIVARGVDVMGELLPEEFEDGKIYF